MDILLWIATTVFLLYLLFILPTKWLKVERVQHSTGINKRILQISDLHVDMLRISAEQLRTIIGANKPDYIFLTGDFTYRNRYIPRLTHYLNVISDCGIPVYAVLGNHDYQSPRLTGSILDIFDTYGIPVLRNESLSLPDFDLVGIDDYGTGHSKVEKAFKGISNKRPVIVITHDPNVVLRIKHPYHYLMAGHLHGKQLNVPFFFKLKPKGPLAARGIYKGLHTNEYGTFYISKGIGQAGVNARFMVRSEITLHNL